MDWLKISNKVSEGKKIVDLDIEGVIGGGWFVEGVTSETLNQDLKELNAIEADVLNIRIINSPGGSVAHGLAMIDLIDELPAEKHVKILGMAASMAAVLAHVAPLENIEATGNAAFLLHNIQGMAFGTIQDVKGQIKLWADWENRLAEIVSDNSGVDIADVKSLMSQNGGQGEFMTAKEAEEKGLIGSVGNAVRVAACVDNETLKAGGLPQIPEDIKKGFTQLKNTKMDNEKTPNWATNFLNTLKKNSKEEKPEVKPEVKPEPKEEKEPENVVTPDQLKAIEDKFDLIAKENADLKKSVEDKDSEIGRLTASGQEGTPDNDPGAGKAEPKVISLFENLAKNINNKRKTFTGA